MEEAFLQGMSLALGSVDVDVNQCPRDSKRVD